MREEIRQCEEAYAARLNDLRSHYEPSVSLAALPQLRKRGAGLRQAKSIGALLTRYRGLDVGLRLFEEALADVAIGWDQHVERESDRASGRAPAITWTGEDGREHVVYLN